MSNTEALRAAAQAVLDRWDSPQWEWIKQGPTADLMHALRAALAQTAASGEPVHQWRTAYCADWYDGHPDNDDGGGPYETRTLYTAQPAPALVPLTEAQIAKMRDDGLFMRPIVPIIRAIEAAHGIAAPDAQKGAA